MKNKFLFLGLTLGMIGLASCTSNNEGTYENTVNEEPSMTFTATHDNVDGSTRTALQNGTTLVWTDGDAIDLNGIKCIVSNISNDGRRATFRSPVIDTPFNAIYPADLEYNATAQKYNFPLKQTYKENSIGIGAFPMHATSNTLSLKFSNDACILIVPLKGTKKIKSIYVSCEYPNSMDNQWANFASPGQTTELDCSKEVSNGVQLNSDTPTKFYITLPQNAFLSKVTIIDTEGNVMAKTASLPSGYTDLNKTYTMPVLTYVPTDDQFTDPFNGGSGSWGE